VSAKADKAAKAAAGAAGTPDPALGDSSVVAPNAKFGIPCVY
jgi:hypothetical protein